MTRIAWILCLVIGCVDSKLVVCGDVTCPLGSVCTPGGCATPVDIAACAGLLEGTPCTAANGGNGTCAGGACRTDLCGNGVLDPAEHCDDGNEIAGDGCRADCRKLERCGDGELDVGERCDDGNTNPVDGCDTCMSTTWRATAVIGGTPNATAIGLAFQAQIAVDRYGTLFIADKDHHRILRVDVSGVVTTVAGNGTPGQGSAFTDEGDGGPATSARLNKPEDVAVDDLGNIYIADTLNHRIRRVDPSGIITTVAGGGGEPVIETLPAAGTSLFYPTTVAVDGLGNVYFTEAAIVWRIDDTGILRRVAGGGLSEGDGGPAIEASVVSNDIAFDGLGNTYLADAANQRIRRIDTTGIITTVAGDGTEGSGGDGGAATSAQLNHPAAVAIDDLGNLYIADRFNHRIRRVDPNGVITTVAGIGGLSGFDGDNGPATSARLAHACGVALDGTGNLYISDQFNNRVRRVDAAGVISTAVGNGTHGVDGGAATSARLDDPAGTAIDGAGNLYIASPSAFNVRRVDRTGVITTVAGTGGPGFSGDGGPATRAQLLFPYDVAIDGAANLYIADAGNHRIRRVDATGIITTVAGDGTEGGGGDGGPATSAQLNFPAAVAVDTIGNVYIAEAGNHRIRRIDVAGVITTVAGTGSAGFGGDGGAATSAQLDTPFDIQVDSIGNLYVADVGNERIRRVDTAGIITTVAGTGIAGSSGDGSAATSAQLSGPRGVALDGLGGFYIADSANYRVRRVDANGIITTVAGTGTAGFAGDGGAAISAEIEEPQSVVVDSLGNLYISDLELWWFATNNSRVRRVDTAGRITTVVGPIDPDGVGSLAQARLADPRALVITPLLTLIAGGSSGRVQAAHIARASLEIVAGRYPQSLATGALARFRDASFGEVAGIAFDGTSNRIYVTESTSHRLHVVTIGDLNVQNTWTIAPLANASGVAGLADGAAQTARFREPAGQYFDAATRQLYIADAGNHVIRVVDLASGVASATVRTIAGTPATLGFFGDGGDASSGRLFSPQAITRCPNGDLFIADTGNHRVRRVAAATNVITTVLGDGVAASTGDGRPATAYPVSAPRGLACDARGNLYVTSTTTIRLLPADEVGVVDGTGDVQTIYGGPPGDRFPQSVTRCLTGLAIVDAVTVHAVDSCSGLLVELRRETTQ